MRLLKSINFMNPTHKTYLEVFKQGFSLILTKKHFGVP